MLYHESDLRIEEHYTDTAGSTDHVFALMHLLGFRFSLEPGYGRHRAVEYGVAGTVVGALRASGREVGDRLLQYLSPLGWEHINLTGDYVWRQSRKLDAGRFRALRNLVKA